ncbi:uroporphyrinogen-III C-methyltransferase [Actinomycetospora sp. NBRC 106375]|uniref:uroporphyrinogen-III C-methyltransferase n=1 Tax=Actinomycetospora sp. NBRC 106375 TaxID=3032207 RepID=UPI0024A05BC5|nr:uroporphyrinogen-III C-methyltransferase [Actinomycetospora sp. NBRC 106375]GLZ50341.1 uroporphyrinogen-III C-methyltransferase [Actinomycetospora sp. NBRC 106375]
MPLTAEDGSTVGTPWFGRLLLTGLRVVVVGGGDTARPRVAELLAAGADVTVVAPELVADLAKSAAAGEITWCPRRYEAGDLHDAWLVVACAGDGAADAQVAADAVRQRTFCVGSGTAPGSVVAVPRPPADPDRSRHSPPCSARGVALIGGGPGAPDLMTLRARRLLAAADVVVVDRLAPREVLDELDEDVEIVDAGKTPYGPAMPQDQINELLIERARRGRFVVRLKGGDPFVYGRGYEELLACTAAGVPVAVVPGVTSAIAGPSAAGVPVSHRGVAHEVVLVAAHSRPGDPQCLVDWEALGRMRGTIVLMMGVLHLEEVAATLVRCGRDPDTPAVVVQDATTAAQRVVRARLDTVAAAARSGGVRPPAVVVIGAVAGLSATGAAVPAADALTASTPGPDVRPANGSGHVER